MFLLCVILCCVWWSSPVLSINSIVLDTGEPNSNNDTGIRWGYYTQKLNHFNLSDDRTWNQNYITDDAPATTCTKVFIFIVGKESNLDKWLNNGFWIEFAREFDVRCFYIVQHRYYGKNFPTEDISTENLVYLTKEQALADIAMFIKKKREHFSLMNRSPVIVFGGSYAGSLAVHMRIKYPHLVHAAVSSSGPLWAKEEFNEYFVAIENSLASYNPECVSQIKMANKMIHELLKTDDGTNKLTKRFELCRPLDRNNEKDVSYLFLSLASRIANVVQYNKINRRYKNPERGLVTIKSICDIMVDKSIPKALDRYAAVVNNLLYVDDTKFGCTPSYDQMVQYYSNISWESESAKNGARQWKYQICTELGLFQTTGQSIDFVGYNITLQYYTKMCSDIFGKTYNPSLLADAVAAETTTITNYKELVLKSKRIIYVQGSQDPWHKLGVTQSKIINTHAVFINGSSHCADMYPKSSDDDMQLKIGRAKIKVFLNSFINQSIYD